MYIFKAPGRLILLLSLLVEIICFYWINYTSCVLDNDGIFSYEIILNNWRGVLDIIAFSAFALMALIGENGFKPYNVVPLLLNAVVFLVSGKNGGVILLLLYCTLVHICADMYEVVDSHHEFIVLDAVIVVEIIIGVVAGKLYRSNLPELPVVSKAMWLVYILEFFSIIIAGYYLFNRRRKQLEYKEYYNLKIKPQYSISEIDPTDYLTFMFLGNVVPLIVGLIVLVTRIFKKGAFALLSVMGLIRVSLVTALINVGVFLISDTNEYQKKDGKWMLKN